jgi:DNA-binding protein
MAADENVVYIGKKGIMSYVLAAITQFNQGAPSVAVKARGKSISRAVDVVEILRNKFMNELKVDNIAIQTEELANNDGTKSKVSAIEITISK